MTALATTRESWAPDRWDDGYVDNKGRFRVHRPDYPNAYDFGYALRYHVVWWLEHGECHPSGTDLHHRNGDRLDDEIENLELMSHADHTGLHRSMPGVELVCARCEEFFSVPAWRVRSRAKRGSKIKFCSNKCRCGGPRGDMLQ